MNTIVPQVMISFKSIKKTIFTDEKVKKDMEKRFISSLSIVAPQISHYISCKREWNNKKNISAKPKII